jgi:hypothetical protein
LFVDGMVRVNQSSDKPMHRHRHSSNKDKDGRVLQQGQSSVVMDRITCSCFKLLDCETMQPTQVSACLHIQDQRRDAQSTMRYHDPEKPRCMLATALAQQHDASQSLTPELPRSETCALYVQISRIDSHYMQGGLTGTHQETLASCARSRQQQLRVVKHQECRWQWAGRRETRRDVRWNDLKDKDWEAFLFRIPKIIYPKLLYSIRAAVPKERGEIHRCIG